MQMSFCLMFEMYCMNDIWKKNTIISRPLLIVMHICIIALWQWILFVYRNACIELFFCHGDIFSHDFCFAYFSWNNLCYSFITISVNTEQLDSLFLEIQQTAVFFNASLLEVNYKFTTTINNIANAFVIMGYLMVENHWRYTICML